MTTNGGNVRGFPAMGHACRYAAQILAAEATNVGDFYEPYDEWTEEQRERFVRALGKLSGELHRRSRNVSQIVGGNVNDSPTIGLIAATFAKLSAYGDATNGLHWREAAAKTLEDVAVAVEAGMDRRAIVTVCRAAAQAFREPARTQSLRKQVEKELEGI